MPLKLNWSNLAKDYKKLGTIDAVAERYRCRRETVSKWRRKLGVPKNLNNYHHYKINSKFFEKLTPKVAYILGYTAADGNITPSGKKERGPCVRWQTNDLELLQQIRKAMGSTHPIKKIRFKAFELRIYNKKIYESLIDWGLMPNKTFLLSPMKKIESKFQNHFVRGCFDGDGTISYNKNPAQKCFTSNIACGSKEFIYWLQKIIPTKGGSLFKRRTYYVLTYGRLDTLKLGEFMYKNATIYLDRKYQKFKLAGLKT